MAKLLLTLVGFLLVANTMAQLGPANNPLPPNGGAVPQSNPGGAPAPNGGSPPPPATNGAAPPPAPGGASPPPAGASPSPAPPKEGEAASTPAAGGSTAVPVITGNPTGHPPVPAPQKHTGKSGAMNSVAVASSLMLVCLAPIFV